MRNYDDVELVTVKPAVRLTRSFGRAATYLLPLVIVVGGVCVGLAGLLWWRFRSRKPAGDSDPYQKPREINPFATIAYLDRLLHASQLDAPSRLELTRAKDSVQRHFFAPRNGHSSLELRDLVDHWSKRVANLRPPERGCHRKKAATRLAIPKQRVVVRSNRQALPFRCLRFSLDNTAKPNWKTECRSNRGQAR